MSEPTRIELIDDNTDDPALHALFARARTGFGIVPNLYRTLGHAPELLEAWLAFAWPLRHAAVAPRALRELVIVRVAELLESDYEATHHRPMALAAGCSADQLEQLSAWRNAPAEVFGRPERSALAVAERVALGEAVRADEWHAFASAFTTREQVELVLTASFYVCVARLLATLDVPLDDVAAPADESGDEGGDAR